MLLPSFEEERFIHQATQIVLRCIAMHFSDLAYDEVGELEPLLEQCYKNIDTRVLQQIVQRFPKQVSKTTIIQEESEFMADSSYILGPGPVRVPAETETVYYSCSRLKEIAWAELRHRYTGKNIAWFWMKLSSRLIRVVHWQSWRDVFRWTFFVLACPICFPIGMFIGYAMGGWVIVAPLLLFVVFTALALWVGEGGIFW